MLESGQSNDDSAGFLPECLLFWILKGFFLARFTGKPRLHHSAHLHPMIQDPIQSAGSPQESPLRGEFHDDPDMREIVRSFLQEIPRRVERLDALMASRDRAEVHRLVHQLKGAGGGYGFQEISNAAARVERCMKLSGDQWCRDCQEHLRTFRTLLTRAHAGLAEME